jgi:hypothetical protein
VQVLLADGRGYSFVRERARLIEEQSAVYVAVQTLLINRKIPQMPSISLGRSFTRLLTAAEPENRSKQKNRQEQRRHTFGVPDDTHNHPNESVFHCYFLLKINNLSVLSRQGYSSGPRKAGTT